MSNTRGKAGRRLLAAAAIVAVGAAGTLATASAAEAAGPVAIHTTAWSGYQSTPANGLASAGTTFKIPTIDCSAGNAEGENFGLWGGTGGLPHYETAVVETYCTGTTPVYQFYVQSDSFNFTGPGANPGDTVVASFSQTGSWNEARVHDLTSGYSWVANSVAPAESTIAAAGVSIYPIAQSYVAPFTAVTFSKNQINGDYLGFQTPVATAWYRSNTALVTPSAISNQDTFRVTYRNS